MDSFNDLSKQRNKIQDFFEKIIRDCDDSLLSEIEDMSLDEPVSSALNSYIGEINKYHLLTPEKEKEILKRICLIKNCKLIKYDSENKPTLDIDKIFLSLSNYNYDDIYILFLKEIILMTKNRARIEKLEEYVYKSTKKQKFLSKQELKKIYNINLNNYKKEEILEEQKFLENLKKYIDYLKSREMMINSNLRLVVYVAKKYNFTYIDLLDLINEGNIGLITAIDKFDINKGNKFSTYAIWWIKQAIFNYLYNNTTFLKISRNNLIEINRFNKKVKQLQQEKEKNYSFKELAEIFNLDYFTISKYLNFTSSVVSLESKTGEDDSNYIDNLISDTSVNVEQTVCNNQLKEELELVLNKLTEKEKMVLLLRYGLLDSKKKPLTLEETGKELESSLENIRIIEKKALRKLRNPYRSKNLQSYLYD